jgi:hypothetical protein
MDRGHLRRLDLLPACGHALLHADVECVLAPRGFEPAADLKWVRGQDAPVRQLFGFAKWKGGVMAPRWGVSLDFAPHLSGAQLKWHRSNKTAVVGIDPGVCAQVDGEWRLRCAPLGIEKPNFPPSPPGEGGSAQSAETGGERGSDPDTG